jgi:hypothetical protein
VVGLAALIAVVVSSGTLFIKSEEAEPVEAARALVLDDSMAPRAVFATVMREYTAYSNPVPGVFAAPPTVRGDSKALVVPAAPTADRIVGLVPGSAASPRSAPTVKPAGRPAGEEAEETASAAPGAECPRSWIAIEGEGPVPTQCDDGAALLDVAAVPDEQRALEKAAFERGAEIAGLEFASRTSQVRSEPPAVTQTASRETAPARWPADPPPKCESGQRAKWHYVDRVPTWYCRSYKGQTALARWPADPPPKCGSSQRAKWRYVNRVPTWYCRTYNEGSLQAMPGAGLH